MASLSGNFWTLRLQLLPVNAGKVARSIRKNCSTTRYVNRPSLHCTFGPGVAFGEFALFDGGTRVADVVAETPATCYELKFEDLAKLEKLEPEVYHQILFALGRLMSDRMRRMTEEIRALA